MNIYNDGVKETDNSYGIYILGKDERLAGIKTKQRIALYDSRKSKIFKGTKYSSGFTQDILDQLKIDYKLCDNFDNLGNYDILIFGANSFDDNVKKNGEKIREWINNGGKVICLEQTAFLGPLPFASEYQICDVRDNRFTFADLLVPQHPIFEGLEIYDWDMWDGGTLGKIGGKVILPLADSALAVSGSHGIPGMLISEFKIGKGTVLVSLAEALFQYNKDSVASRYVENLFKYALSDKTEKIIPNYSIPEIKGNKIKEYSIPKLDANKSSFIDLRTQANRSFIDEKGSDGTGGWFDEGKNQDLKDFPVGRQEFKGVTFDIIDPSKNHEKSCIVLNTEGNKRYPVGNRKDQVEIIVNSKVKRLVFLVASAWCTEEGPPMAEFIVKFQGGECLDETVKIDLTPGVNISDWFIKGGNLPGAKLAWTTFDRRVMSKVGVWMFQWENSQPQANIAKIIFKSKHTKAIPALIAITGEKF
jgi:beta-galactosidase